jgi:tetratricopeptide (TPR) repeat protein
MKEKLADLCAASFKEKNYLLLLDDFEQNLEGADQGQPGPLLPEAFDLLEVLLHYLPFSGKMTQLLITCRYRFSLEEQGNDLVEERLEPVCLTSFQESEQFKKARELKNILTYADQSAVPQLLTAGHGNPRLMEWLDILVGEMAEAEVPQLLDAIRNKQEEFIRKHVIRELLHRGGDELARFLRWLGIFRRPVLLEGVQEVGDKAGLKGWKELLEQGLSLSLVEHDQARKSYVVTPLLREELSADLEDLQFCHEAAFAYYKKICEPTEQLDHILFEEWIFHALGCGEEDTASEQGGLLVTHLRERLAFQESRRVGQWVMAKKKRKLSTEHDAFLLYELAFTINDLGDHRNAISHYEQTLTIARANFGEKHPHVGSTLNSLGTAWHALGDYHKAIEYFEQALNIDLLVFGDEHPEVANVLNNLGATWDGLGNHHKAIDYYQQALTIFKKVYGEKHPQIAAGWNNLGTACYDLGDYRKAIDYFEQALLIDRALYGDEHPDVAARLNNLGDAWRVLGEPRKAIAYLEKALIIDQTVFGEEHPKISTRLNNLGSAWYDLGDYHKAIDYYEQALSIDLVVFGEKHYNVARHLNNLGSVWFALGDHRRAIDYFEQALKIRKEVLGEKHPDVATILSNLGAACYGLSDHRRAIDYFEQALKIWKAVVGEKHPQVATILNNLGLAWQASGELKKAVEYCHHALNIDRSVYGDEHPDVARDLSNLGTAYIALGKNAEAKGYFEQAYAIFKKFFGEEHPHTKTASGWLEKCSKG